MFENLKLGVVSFAFSHVSDESTPLVKRENGEMVERIRRIRDYVLKVGYDGVGRVLEGGRMVSLRATIRPSLRDEDPS